MVANEKCRGVEPPISTAIGSSRGARPIRPAIAVRRSWSSVPAGRPRAPSLNEVRSLATMVTISAVESGNRTSPDWNSG